MANEQKSTILSTTPTEHNFKIYISGHLIPKLIGEDGKNIFHKVTQPSIHELKKIYVNDNLQKTLDAVKDGSIKIVKRFTIKDINTGYIASWRDTNELGVLNVTLNEIIKKNLTKESHEIMKKNEIDEEGKIYESIFKKKSQHNFNYRLILHSEFIKITMIYNFSIVKTINFITIF